MSTIEDTQTNIIPLDQRGHRFHGWPSPHYIKRDIAEVRRLLDLMPGYPLASALYIHIECTWCGERPTLEFQGDTVVSTTECTSVDGVTTVIDLHVPSGKIIVSDDLRPIYNAITSDLDYNTALGQGKFVERMAEIGCAYGPVGNTCPSLYKTGEGTYVIANPRWDENDDEIDDLGDRLAGICTDLWAYSIADYDDWVSKGGKVDSWTQTVVEIPPGTYRFTHHTGERSWDPDDTSKPTIYAHIEKVS